MAAVTVLISVGGALRASQEAASDYVLHNEDEFTIHSIVVKELSDKTFRIDRNGDTNFSMIGVEHLAGLSARKAEKKLVTDLSKFYKEPDIEIAIVGFHAESISVIGSVGVPGVYPLKNQVRLLDALSSAGGVRGDAGPVAIVTRQAGYGLIPHHDARQKLSGESTVEINLSNLMHEGNSADNFVLAAQDVVSVPAAQLVYVLGHVKRSGGFPLGGRPNLSVLQALALAEGLDAQAAPARTQILRRSSSSEKLIAVDVKKIIAGKEEDIVLLPNDVLYVPNNALKTITTRTIDAAIQIGTGLAIFHP